MPRTATPRLKVNPPVGRMPVLQFIPPAELAIDGSYQRGITMQDSQKLIRRIAQQWDWGLCQPLVVSRRPGTIEQPGGLFVIDGQHRLAAAKLRRDIAQLPCVVLDYADPAAEAASFVQLNQQRRPLNRIDLFRAALASGEEIALGIAAAVEAAGLTVAPHTNNASWKTGMVGNIAGIEAAWRREGPDVTTAALRVLGQAWPRRVLHYAGTIFPGIVAVCNAELREFSNGELPVDLLAKIVKLVGGQTQEQWRDSIAMERARHAGLNFGSASAQVLLAAWRSDETVAPAAPVAQTVRALAPFALPAVAPDAASASGELINFRPADDGTAWCNQCDQRVSRAAAEGCRSKWCSFKGAKR